MSKKSMYSDPLQYHRSQQSSISSVPNISLYFSIKEPYSKHPYPCQTSGPGTV